MNRHRHTLIMALFLLTAGVCAAAEEPAPEWPREYTGEKGGKLLLYQPQVTGWENYTHIEARAAMSFTPPSAEAPLLGTFRFSADTETDLEQRRVLVDNFRILEVRFPSADEETQRGLEEHLPEVFPEDGVVVALDRILANLEQAQETVRTTEIKTDPPVIFTSMRPAVLVLLDGKPIKGPIENNDLTFVVNTNWDLFFHSDTSSYYLLDGDAWLKAPTLGGPWSPASKLPKSFKKLPKNDENWKQVRENVPGRKLEPEEVPEVYLSQTPAELIVIYGTPQLSMIPETELLWVTNTDSDLFLLSTESQFYYLVAGRWFRAPTVEGPWSFASADLPGDFSRIPEDHERGRVLASVPGTPDADDAVILAQIPQKAEVSRDTVAPEVTYEGDPVFQPIQGTSMRYAVNTPNDIIRVGDLYYLCHEAVWFVSTDAAGPWEVADKVPDEVYTIPSDSPVYRTTYVYVYDTSPTYVVYGYTSGYWGVYYSHGCVVYGTGWYYPPYLYWGPYYPVYWGYPSTYGVRAYYNPHTGRYGRGAGVYGPYGGMGRGAAYNPRTGTYARGGAAWGPHNAGGWAEAYNPRTGTHAATRQGANSYSQWGSSVVRRGDKWAQTGHYSDRRGTVAGVRTSEGTGALAYRGDQGSGFIAKGKDNLYAGKDGEIYRRGESGGWEKHGDGGWNQVEGPQRGEGQRGERGGQYRGEGQRADRSGGVERGGQRGSDRSTMQQLERDRSSRMQGNRRTNQYRSWNSNPRGRSSYGGGARGGGGRSRGGRGRRG